MKIAGGAMALVLTGTVATVAAQLADLPSGRVVDLTHPFDQKTVYWPTEKGFALEKKHEGMTDKGYYYAANEFCAPEHGGTHIDAPIHFAKGRLTVDAIPPERLIGRAVVIDVSRKSASTPDYQVTVDDLRGWEKTYGKIPPRAIVLLRTGFGRFWPDRRSYLGTDGRGEAAVAKLHFPGLEPEAARWLVKQRSVKAVGIDTASIDFGQSTLFETHRALFEQNVPALENLANLDMLPPTGLAVIALPMKIKGGSGGPLRAVAILEESSILDEQR